ncbi:FecR family protein [Chitinophaga sp. LS1]|uniref:FecR family protein n=1 Tax=Chitinophaga sp. LS1 TaxID=3051176 RepID=UPI002AABB8BE|nr:FecR domain-containing protein [Chitinophaga sp. LS1]WPV67845.1 FecR domain-containing protein [Chitinophaga sp. LS1]
MPVDSDYIEQLVLEEITGVISPEDHVKLLELIAQEPKAKAIWDELHAQLPENYMAELRQKLAVELPADGILDKIREKRKVKRFTIVRQAAAYLAAAGVILLLVKLLWWPAPKVSQPIVENTISTRGATLEVPGKGNFTLNKRFDTLSLGVVTVYKNDDTIWWTNGGKVTDAHATIPDGISLYMRFPDGSKIWMNARSTINFPMAFNGDNRELSIKGEAYLDVAPDPLRPFVVNVPNAKVAVLGTAFGINTLDGKKVSVALTRGKVQMRTFKDSLLLTPGLAVCFKQGQKLKAVPFDTAALLKRQKGIYTFNNATIGEIVNVLNRVRPVPLIIQDNVDTMRFSGAINMKAPLARIFEDVRWENQELDFDVSLNQEDSVIHLLRRRGR